MVSPLQTAFVPGRKGLDNMIIVQELIHTMSTKKGSQEYMAIKIDLEKAYDRLEWHFVRDVLNLYNLPQDTVKLIMSYISSSSILVLFNGGQLDPFLPSRGIRQGDLLSHYLFILCMEVLGFLIVDQCSSHLWDPIKSSQSGPSFSHLFFADDLVLFAKADLKNCQSIRDALDTFCELSGQKVNMTKSKVFFSPNVGQENRDSFCNILGFRSTPNLGKYLGFPIQHKGSSSRDFDFVLERVHNKLQGWKANLLSMAGRLTFTKVVLFAIPSYTMQRCILPSRIHTSLDKVCRNFLWGSTVEKKNSIW